MYIKFITCICLKLYYMLKMILIFRSKSHYALSVKRLWQYLVKQEMVQETFIRNIFAKRKCLNEVSVYVYVEI